MRCGSPANRTVRNPHGSVRPTNRTATPRFGSWGARTATVRHGSPRFATVRQTPAVHHCFSWFTIFFHAGFTPIQTYQVSFPSRSICAQSVSADSCIVNTLFAYLIEFSLHLHPLRIHPRRPSHAFSRTIALFIPSFTHSPHSADAVLQFSHTRSIRRSHFGRFCTISAFDGRVLAGFAQSLHSTVAFWQLFLSAFSHSAPAPRLAYDRIFAAFAYSQHSTVAFWQVLHNLCIRRSRFDSFCTISAFDGRVLAAFPLRILPRRPAPRSRVRSHFAAFAHSQHSTVAFWQVLHNLCIRRSGFGRFCTIFVFDGHILAGFAQSPHSTVAFWQLFLSAFTHAALAPRSRIR